jgi:hypothetical protein
MRTIHAGFCLVTFAASFAPIAAAGDFPANVQERLAKVEHSLIPSVRFKGRKPSMLNKRMEQPHVAGVRVAVLDNDQTAWAKAFGLAVTSSTR